MYCENNPRSLHCKRCGIGPSEWTFYGCPLYKPKRWPWIVGVVVIAAALVTMAYFASC